MNGTSESHTPHNAAHTHNQPGFDTSEAQYRLLVEKVQDYAIFIEDQTGRIRTWNGGAERVLDYAEAEVLGQLGAIIFTPEDRATGAPEQEIETAQAEGQALDERWHLRKGDQRFWGSGAMIALRDQTGTLHGFAKIIRDYTQRKTLEEALRERENQLQQFNEQLVARIDERTAQLRQLAAEIVLAEQQERERIAQILHDDLQQLLYGLQFQLNLLHTDLPPLTPPNLAASFQESEAMISQSIQLVRQLTVDLSPPVLQSEGLVEMLRWLANHMQQMYGLQITVQAQLSPQLYSIELRIFLFQLVRELLFNVVKHAGVSQAQVSVQGIDQKIAVQVSDQGHGFDVARVLATPHAGGYGLRSIQQRLTLFHGQLQFRSQPGMGADVTILLPLHPPSPSTEA